MPVRYAVVRRFDLQALAITLPEGDGAHPNRVPFSGVLTRVDEPSTRPPHGSRGHRVLITAAVAERVGPSLIGMAVDVSEDLTDHTTKKVGIITAYDIDGHDFKVSGFIYGKDFPDVVDKLRRERGRLGMSFEITEVGVEDEQASVWALNDFVFTGAAILKKKHAAYELTELVARRSRRSEMKRAAVKGMEELLEKANGIMVAMKDDEEDDEEKAATETDAAKDAEAADAEADAEAAKAKGNPFKKDEDEEEEDDEDAGAESDAAAEVKAAARTLRRAMAGLEAARAKQRGEVAAGAINFEAQAVHRRLGKIEAAVGSMQSAQELMTDTLTAIGTMMTDYVSNDRNLATDRAKRGAQGGKVSAARRKTLKAADDDGAADDVVKPRPKRLTMAAADSHQFLQKYGLEASKDYTTSQVDDALRNAGVSDPTQRIAVKHFLESTGQLQPVGAS